jgi:hypothetical protein
MTRPQLADRVMRARREGTCPLCRPILVGQYIARCGSCWYHAGCVVRSIAPQADDTRTTSTEEESE